MKKKGGKKSKTTFSNHEYRIRRMVGKIMVGIYKKKEKMRKEMGNVVY